MQFQFDYLNYGDNYCKKKIMELILLDYVLATQKRMCFYGRFSMYLVTVGFDRDQSWNSKKDGFYISFFG